MKKYNIIMVFNEKMDKILMCKRTKDPYNGLYNLVGGKIEPGEDGLDGAYRELFEETGISKDNIKLTFVMSFTYNLLNSYLEAYAGRLNEDVVLKKEEQDLFWIDINSNFFDKNIYAGEGNIGHVFEQVKINKDKIIF
ncbi:MAG: NUDIX domain-containing protein [Clostridia bacterium]|nr:NUDIX domain-containing protein [Clostridia bacterium]